MKQKKNKHTAGTIVGIILLVFAVLLCSFAIWGFSTWKGLTLDEIIYHLNAPLEGTGNGMIQSGLLHTLIPAAIALVIAIIFGKKLRAGRTPIADCFTWSGSVPALSLWSYWFFPGTGLRWGII